MKIKELLKNLEKYDPELDVVIHCKDNYCYDITSFITEGYCQDGNFIEIDSDKNINAVKLEIDD